MANLKCRMYETPYPDVDMAVMIEVKHIGEMGVYVSLLEFNNIEGMIQFSELSHRRIRSVSSLIKAGRQEPAIVLRVNREKGYIDLSKRRVSEEDVQSCNQRYNKSKLVHSIMSHVSETLSIDLRELYTTIGWPLYRKYGHAYEAFKMIVTNPNSIFGSLTREIKEMGPDGVEVTKVEPVVTAEVKDALVRNIKRRMTPQPIKIRAVVHMTCYQMDGVLSIQNAMSKAQYVGTEDCPVKIKIIAAPLYVLTTETNDKEKGMTVLRASIKACAKEIEACKGKLIVKEDVKVVSEHEDRLFAKEMENMRLQNKEIAGDEDNEEEEDTGMGDEDLEN